ncbi:MAG TPA: 50S ribosomal protein L17 [Bacteroidales bacterium]|nr:50S ribosomal protein L17 [Bacteroidales bacterium]HOK97594.1 50S ribosomal protein L17 [Bacteroidales bacterium]HPO64414.1 50S ribosomal protein L17 [Bacteroidales bacterium]
MRHNRVINHLGRTSSHRKALLANLAVSLIKHKRINTTLAKAKVLRTFIEPIITRTKEDSTHNRRVAFSYLKDKEAVSILFREIGPKVANRPGGYTRILKLGNRVGDNAEICMIELVDFNENMLKTSTEKKAKTTRRGRGKKSQVAAAPAQQAQAETTNTPSEDVTSNEQSSENKQE